MVHAAAAKRIVRKMVDYFTVPFIISGDLDGREHWAMERILFGRLLFRVR